jgi:uracil-DNA glycosylase
MSAGQVPGAVGRRAHYLEALGLDLWVPRTQGKAATPVAPAAEAAPAPSAIPTAAAAPTVAAPIARKAGGAADTWESLAAEVAGCTACGLHASRKQTVFGVGDHGARLLVVGEAPGADEDAKGEPFVGRAGQLLNSMLRAMGSPRDTVFIANVLKCRPPGNRDPEPREVACCLPFLHRQIALLKPQLMLAVGRIAAQNLLATETPIGQLRGKLHSFGPAGIPLVVTYHPAYLLRSPGEKRKAWKDLSFARAQLQRSGTAAPRAEGPRAG